MKGMTASGAAAGVVAAAGVSPGGGFWAKARELAISPISATASVDFIVLCFLMLTA
jgi:hypothetical protein